MMNVWFAMRWVTLPLALLGMPISALAKEDQSFDPPAEIMNKPSPVLSPEEALKTFELEEGFEIQLVAAEPLVEDPVCMAWDSTGRLWVCEMRGYMPDQFAKGEQEPTGRIVILEDLNGDGVFDEQNDKHTVFLDQIILPRAIAFTKGGVLYADFEKLYFVSLNPDGSAGQTTVVDPVYSNDGKGTSNVEHQANGLLYGLDNYYYNARSSRRYRLDQGKLRLELTENRGQWGISQDDGGRILTNSNPRPIQYELLPPTVTQRNPNFTFNKPVIGGNSRMWPAVPTPGLNRGYRPGVLDRKTWKLRSATATCGPVIYRGTQFPEAYYNNVFVPEPAGNLVKRYLMVKNNQGRTAFKLAYEGKEFITSTDERNRFVNAYTGPDGALYLVDMYRGLIQHQTYISEYLRRQVNARKLDAPLGSGRIYRVVHKNSKIDHARVNLAAMDAPSLVALLGHPNAWQRHNAQRLLVERSDVNSVDLLNVLATTSENPQARIHALWTLEGMGKLTAGTLALAGRIDDSRVHVQVLRLSEAFAGTPNAKPLVALMQTYAQAPSDWSLEMQLALSAGVLAGIDTPEAYDVLLGVMERRGKDKLFLQAIVSGLRGKEAVMLAKIEGDGEIKKMLTGALAKATKNGDLSIDSLLELVDSPQFAKQRNDLLTTLADQAVTQDLIVVVDKLIQKIASEDEAEEGKRAILQGMANGRANLSRPMELDGKPEVFTALQAQAPETLAELVGQLNDIFVYERKKISAEVQARIDAGRLLYGAQCASCHREDGAGLHKSAPPLSPSNWVDASPKMLAALVLNGVEGDITVNGKLYTAADIQPSMRSFKNAPVTDQEIADILTYIRSREFGNNADPVDVQVVADARKQYASRSQAMSPDELWSIHLVEIGGVGPLVVKASWLSNPIRGLVLTLVTVSAMMVVLLVGTLLASRRAKV